MSENKDFALDMGNVSNTASEGSEADLGRVTESMAKAAQIKGQMKQLQQENNLDAYLMSILFKYVESEILLHDVFMFVIQQQISIRVIFVFFLPFVYTRIDRERLTVVYAAELQLLEQIELDLVRYVGYCKQMYKRYPTVSTIHTDKYLSFVREVIIHYRLVARDQLDDEKKQSFEKTIKENLL